MMAPSHLGQGRLVVRVGVSMSDVRNHPSVCRRRRKDLTRANAVDLRRLEGRRDLCQGASRPVGA